ncbi:MAG: hypothetical protein E4H01_14950, partial [Lysobacterales bacterium]
MKAQPQSLKSCESKVRKAYPKLSDSMPAKAVERVLRRAAKVTTGTLEDNLLAGFQALLDATNAALAALPAAPAA